MIGIRVPYQKHDATFMAFRTAAMAVNMGLDVQMMPIGKPQQVHPAWDRVVSKAHKQTVVKWLEDNGINHLVYVGKPTNMEELKLAEEQQIKTTFICMWELLTKDDASLLGMFDTVLCPVRKSVKLLTEKFGLDYFNHICWDPGVPITRDARELDPRKISVLWSLDGSQATHQDSKFMDMLDTVLQKCPGIWLTIPYSQTLPDTTIRELRKLSHYADGRIELVRNPSWDKHVLLYGKHDLTVWPSIVESVCHVGLCSLFMGTPVLAFDHPAIGEVVRDGKNGELVPCDLESNWLGVPFVKPNYRAFTNQLVNLVNHPEKISHMREWCATGLKDRQEKFKALLARVFE